MCEELCIQSSTECLFGCDPTDVDCIQQCLRNQTKCINGKRFLFVIFTVSILSLSMWSGMPWRLWRMPKSYLRRLLDYCFDDNNNWHAIWKGSSNAEHSKVGQCSNGHHFQWWIETSSSENRSEKQPFNEYFVGEVDNNINFIYEEGTEVYISSGVTLNGEFWIFGGANNRRQVSQNASLVCVTLVIC